MTFDYSRSEIAFGVDAILTRTKRVFNASLPEVTSGKAEIVMAVVVGDVVFCDRFIYDDATGALFFDADGTGSLAQVQLAQLSANLVLGSSDIAIV